ncbi:TnsA endonuclease N-terminal domain-containing protein [Idiomarina abyssalis]|uniref:TnsA endonuclease N-terminal domain-containing protein n=1 Tax=Idiomarina abyssalis TaxID=86102 RepID=UPI003A8EAB29
MIKKETVKVKQPRITMTQLNKIKSWCDQEEKTGKYKPFLKAMGSSTVGTSHTGYNESGDFNHEMLSQNEKHLGRLLRFMPNVVNIKFQFPLLPITETMDIAKQLNIVHPGYQKITSEGKRKHASVMTTDVFIEYANEDGELCLMALSLKYIDIPSELVDESDQVKQRTKDKLQLEKAYWDRLGINWRLVTRYGPLFNEFFIRNLYEAESRIYLEYDTVTKGKVLAACLELLKSQPRIRFQSFKREISNQTKVKESSVHCIFWQLIWEQKLLVDLTKPIGFNEPVREGKKWVWS